MHAEISKLRYNPVSINHDIRTSRKYDKNRTYRLYIWKCKISCYRNVVECSRNLEESRHHHHEKAVKKEMKIKAILKTRFGKAFDPKLRASFNEAVERVQLNISVTYSTVNIINQEEHVKNVEDELFT